jgi:transcriptional regulator with XRE-family HTH domain
MSERSEIISKLLKNRTSREAYIGAKLKVLIPSQIRALRLKSPTPRQEDLAKAADMKQSRISAMETPGAVNFNLETLVRLASALRVGLLVKFASFSEMLQWENDFTQDQFDVVTLDRDESFQRGEVPTPVESEPLGSQIWEFLKGEEQRLTVIPEGVRLPHRPTPGLPPMPGIMMAVRESGGFGYAASGDNPC